MAFRATGAGQVEVLSGYDSPGMLRALLFNFDFDDMRSTQLKAEHADFLRTRAVPLLRGERGAIMLNGQASAVGGNDYNMRLSRRRCDRVADFLADQGIPRARIRPDAVGEEHPHSTLADDPRDRSVEFVILPLAPTEPPPRRVPPTPMVSRNFRLRLVGDISLAGMPRRIPRGRLGAGPAAEAQIYEIEDVDHHITAFYGYSGMGAGAGFDGAFLSGTDCGPWNDFTTSAPMSVGDFGGFTRFTTAGAGNYTVNYLHMLGTPSGVDTVYMMINTGTTYGAGLSSTAGILQRIAGPMPAAQAASPAP